MKCASMVVAVCEKAMQNYSSVACKCAKADLDVDIDVDIDANANASADIAGLWSFMRHEVTHV